MGEYSSSPSVYLTMNTREFAEVVLKAARVTQSQGGEGCFGRSKVFISAIWNTGIGWDMTESEFKANLVESHRYGFLRLSRADLTPAMDPELVRRSECKYMSAEWHLMSVPVGIGCEW